MGKVRPSHIKKIARELLEYYPNKFNTDFDNNKRMVNSYTNVTSQKIRNRVAGYITRLVKIASNSEIPLQATSWGD